MSETVNNSEEKKSVQKQSGIKKFFKGLKSEFKKIMWPDKQTVAKQTVLVVSIAVLLGVVISAVDAIIKQCFGPIL